MFLLTAVLTKCKGNYYLQLLANCLVNYGCFASLGWQIK